MKIAIIGDVHANLHALDTVLADVDRRKVNVIWNVGDTTGIGAFPEEVVKRLQDRKAVEILGNYDQEVLSFARNAEEWTTTKKPEEIAAYQFAYESLSPESREHLTGLPAVRRIEVDGCKILLCHGSPASIDEHVTEDTPKERFQELAKMADAEIVIFGHSHRPFVKKVAGVHFVNPGSVGRPDDGDPRASYAVFDIRKSAKSPFKLKFYRLEYPVREAVDALREKGLPESFADVLKEGHSLESILKRDSDRKEAHAEKTAQYDNRVKEVAVLASALNHEEDHARHVVRLSLSIFDQLQKNLKLGLKERFWLECAGLLHDIGWSEGRQAHHKTALKLILEDVSLPLNDRERMIVGSIARYHRRALPQMSHSHFAKLKRKDRETVVLLAGILRLADGLDRTHQRVVESVACHATKNFIYIQIDANGDAEPEKECALAKGALLERALDRKLKIEIVTP